MSVATGLMFMVRWWIVAGSGLVGRGVGGVCASVSSGGTGSPAPGAPRRMGKSTASTAPC
jgi:hypothetical protein